MQPNKNHQTDKLHKTMNLGFAQNHCLMQLPLWQALD